MRKELSKKQTAMRCETCHGARLKPEALAVKIAGEDISMSTRRSVVDALGFFSTLPTRLNDQQNQIARAILKEIVERLGFRSEEHTSELQSLMRISYAVFCLKKKTKINAQKQTHQHN